MSNKVNSTLVYFPANSEARIYNLSVYSEKDTQPHTNTHTNPHTLPERGTKGKGQKRGEMHARTELESLRK